MNIRFAFHSFLLFVFFMMSGCGGFSPQFSTQDTYPSVDDRQSVGSADLALDRAAKVFEANIRPASTGFDNASSLTGSSVDFHCNSSLSDAEIIENVVKNLAALLRFLDGINLPQSLHANEGGGLAPAMTGALGTEKKRMMSQIQAELDLINSGSKASEAERTRIISEWRNAPAAIPGGPSCPPLRPEPGSGE